jgi:DNA-binding SARP family transcriptional activator
MTTDLRFTLLGPVRAWRGEAELDLGAPQQRAVLAALLLAGGRQVPMAALIDGLWAADPPRTAAGTVRTYVSRLRRVLGRPAGAGPGAGPDGLIKSAGDGYLLSRGTARLDLDTFVQLTEAARAVQAAGAAGAAGTAGAAGPGRGHADPARAARLLRKALALWQGEPLAGLPGRFAESQRDRLTELRMAAIEERLALDIDLGAHVAAAAELPGLLAGDPLRERLTELLMLALYRSGRQADALAVFGTTQRRLADDLGIDPGPALRDLHECILRTDDSLAPPVPPHTAPVYPVSVYPGPLYSVPRPRRHQSSLRWCDRSTGRIPARRLSLASQRAGHPEPAVLADGQLTRA